MAEIANQDTRYILERFGGWGLILLACAVPVVRWWMVGGHLAGTTSFGIFSSVGNVAGIIGFVLYAINMLLAIRRPWLEAFFGGLNKVYIAHHITGGIALIFLSFHPLFLAARYIDFKVIATFHDAMVYLLPRSLHFDGYFTQVQQAASIDAGIVAFLGMVVLLILTFFVKLPYRFWLFTHRFLGAAFLFAGFHVVLINSDISRDNFLKFYMLIWIVVGLVAFCYRTLFSNVFVRRAPYRVVKTTHSVNAIGIALEPLKKKIDFKPGQFVFIRFRSTGEDGIIEEAHPFSIASAPQDDRLHLYVKALGDFTSSLLKLKDGTIAEVEGAFGRFIPARYGTAEQIWIAGGIGITPFISSARALTVDSPSVTLIHTVRSRDELIEASAMQELIPQRVRQFRFIPFVVAEQPASAKLTATKVVELVGELASKEIFLCGPPTMMKALRTQLRALGVPKRKIHSEEFAMS